MTQLSLHAATFNKFADNEQNHVGGHWISRTSTTALQRAFGDKAFTVGDAVKAADQADADVDQAKNELGQYRYETGGAVGPYKDIVESKSITASALRQAVGDLQKALADPIAHNQLVVLEATLYSGASSELAL